MNRKKRCPNVTAELIGKLKATVDANETLPKELRSSLASIHRAYGMSEATGYRIKACDYDFEKYKVYMKSPKQKGKNYVKPAPKAKATSTKMLVKDNDDIVKALKEITSELKAIRVAVAPTLVEVPVSETTSTKGFFKRS